MFNSYYITRNTNYKLSVNITRKIKKNKTKHITPEIEKNTPMKSKLN